MPDHCSRYLNSYGLSLLYEDSLLIIFNTFLENTREKAFNSTEILMYVRNFSAHDLLLCLASYLG